MAALPDHTPDLTKYTTFVRNVMGIGTNYLPTDSPSLQHSFDHSLDIVNDDLAGATAQRTSWSPYELAVYNLAGHLLIEFAPDVSVPVTAIAWAAGVVTVTTTDPHGLLPGDKVQPVAVSPLALYGPVNPGYVIVQSVPDTTHFTYNVAADPGAITLLPGAAYVGQYFLNARRMFKINSFVPGIVANTSDLTTSVGLDNPDFFKMLTLFDLQLLKTPWGRAYLATAQKVGPTVWGLT